MKKYNDFFRIRNKIPFIDSFFNMQIKKIARALEAKDYETRKQFVEGVCIFLDIQGTTGATGNLHEQLFEKIIVPVFVTEYKKDNAKFIKWIGQSHDLFLYGKNNLNRHLLKQFDGFDADNSFEIVVYFCGKSFMLDKNQKTLDLIMEDMDASVFLLCMFSPDDVHNPEKYLNP